VVQVGITTDNAGLLIPLAARPARHLVQVEARTALSIAGHFSRFSSTPAAAHRGAISAGRHPDSGSRMTTAAVIRIPDRHVLKDALHGPDVRA
jgi:hypothetical protein